MSWTKADVDSGFQALRDPTRRAILDILSKGPISAMRHQKEKTVRQAVRQGSGGPPSAGCPENVRFRDISVC